MDALLIQEVWRRARDTCEYCHMPQELDPIPFEIDHIIAKQHEGRTVLGNLALCCVHCNLHKGPNIAGFDRRTRKLTALFHPRRHKWLRHFQWDGPLLVGHTPIGRVTVAVLAINDPDLVQIRESLIDEGTFPLA